MRDVVDRVLHGHLDYTQKINGNVVNQRSDITTPGKELRARDLSKPSDGHKPTQYKAHRIKITGGDYRRYLKSGSGSFITEQLWEGQENLSYKPSSLGVNSNFYPLVPEWVINGAKSSAQSNAMDSKFDAGVALAELPETVAHLARTAKMAIRALRAARRGDFRAATKEISDKGKDLSGNYLEFMFGWAPLAADLYNAQEGIKNAFKRTNGEVVKATGFRSTSWKESNNSWEGPDVEFGCECSYTFGITDAEVAALSALGLTNPFNVAWEAVPLSFVVDWFVPIGDFFRSLSLPHGLTFSHGYVTTFAKANGMFRYNNGTNQLTKDGWVEYDVDSFAWRRDILLSFPKPGVAIRFAPNLGQVITSIALIDQRR